MSLLEIRSASRSFGSLLAVDEVSMAVETGELRAVIGPNGAGKTTFFNLISGLLSPTAGSIIFDGQDVTGTKPATRVGLGMARTFQITEIFPELTVRENLLIPVELAAGLKFSPRAPAAIQELIDQRVLDLLGTGNLDARADRLAGELSHGDQRATEIMMALALNPRLVLLDEPTAGMGDQETYAIAQLIRRLHRDAKLTIVLIEHDMRVVFNLADRITVLDRGKLLAEGSPKEIASNEVVQAAYLGKTE